MKYIISKCLLILMLTMVACSHQPHLSQNQDQPQETHPDYAKFELNRGFIR